MKCPLCNQEHDNRHAAENLHGEGIGPGSEAFQHAATYGGRLYRELGNKPARYNDDLQKHNAYLNYLRTLTSNR